MASLQTGTVTILFTDIEGSTRMLQSLGPADYGRLLADHHRLIRGAVTACQGIEIKTEGDAFFVIFPTATDAIRAAVQAQRELATREWPGGQTVGVRMGIHTGDVALNEGEYVGLDIHRAARISAAAHGGQVLISDATRTIATTLPDGVSVRDLGEHRLKDIDEPEHLYQLVIAGLRADFPPPRALATRFDLLPPDATAFIGRQAELAQARRLLRAARLLTLLGPGGTGKTRLSIEVARLEADRFADGVAFVPLAPISEPRLVLTTVRQTLGLAEKAGRTALETIVERLSGKEVLIVLDNFEQVIDAANSVSELLKAVPGLTLIVTSRVALHLTGEQEFSVPPLSVPSPEDADDLERLSQSDAVALFLQRARTVRPDFTVNVANARAIVEICTRLDGLPLAIELAASRVNLLPPPALLARLEKSLDVLQSTAADRTDRQRTLRGAIDWSYNLLAEPQRTLYRRLATFIGGWRLDDAEAVIGAAGPIWVDTFEGIAELVDHSLVKLQDDSGERFTMLETIREYGREQCEASGELAATLQAHARHFAGVVEAAEPKLTGGPEWLDRLEADHANLRAALAWLASADVQSALLMGGRLWRFWHLRGHLREGAAVLTALLVLPGARPKTRARARSLLGLAGLVYWQTNYELARVSYEEALAIARELGDEAVEVEILYSLAYVRAIERDYSGATRDLRNAAAIYEKQGNKVMATWALEAAVGMTLTLSGDHEGAVALLEEGIIKFERLGDTFGLRNVIAVLTRALMHLDQLDYARQLNQRVIQLAFTGRDITSLSAVMHDAASLAALSGDLERAAVLSGAAERMVEESGAQPPPELVNRIEALPTLRRDLAPERLDELLARGRRLSTEEAVALAKTS